MANRLPTALMNSPQIPGPFDVPPTKAQQRWVNEGGRVTTPMLPAQGADHVLEPEIDRHMETLVGVDDGRQARVPIELLGRLKFEGNQLTLAHVGAIITPPTMVMMPMTGTYPYDSYAQVRAGIDAHGSNMLNEATDLVEAEGLQDGLREVNTVGGTSSTLMSLADEGQVQLIAIGDGQHGALRSFFLGSVGRALAIGANESFLIARQELGSSGPVRAVFATDHSTYANDALSQLLHMNPEGLKHITLATTMEPSIERRMTELEGREGDKPRTSEEACVAVRQLGAGLVSRIRATGRTADFLLMQGEPVDGLKQAMIDIGADLMILGARGHGLVERIFVGSLALHMVVDESYSLLVIRVPEDVS